jgi:transformation/transcription domain-associated protein
VIEIYTMLPETVRRVFATATFGTGTGSGTGTNTNSGSGSGTNSGSGSGSGLKVLARGKESFKVLTECPIIVVLLLQVRKKIAFFIC